MSEIKGEHTKRIDTDAYYTDGSDLWEVVKVLSVGGVELRNSSTGERWFHNVNAFRRRFWKVRDARAAVRRRLRRQIERFDCGDPADCLCCGEADPLNECPKSSRSCGHHCGHIWTHDACCWCGAEAEGEK